ncbi:LacI family DNA-binding transcriptional regulator [Streptomyces sp. NBC_01003]|uniref:LacI family DNA-binding transcriptional regulator n=1 Tax=Streptomyces sp. NBC_01003 TaxID=2903714 RepID=UPI003868DDD9
MRRVRPERGSAVVADSRGGASVDSGKAAQSDGPTSVKIAHIAELAGVSVPTVSRVLNGRPGVSDETRARVQRALARNPGGSPPGGIASASWPSRSAAGRECRSSPWRPPRNSWSARARPRRRAEPGTADEPSAASGAAPVSSKSPARHEC